MRKDGSKTSTFTYDRVAQAGYVSLRRGKVARTVSCYRDVMIDLDEAGNVVGVEVLFPRGS